MKTLPLWSPSPTALENARVAKFMAEINADFGASCRTYADLHAFSIRETAAFWSKAWDFLGVIGERGTGPVFRPGERFEDAKFFEGARLNYAENLLRKHDDSPALIFWGEDKLKETLSWAALQEAVSRAQQALRARGVGEGDRVAALMPNMPQAIVGFLAASSLGAIWSSASPDFGVGGVLDRFGQIAPKLLIACDGYYYNGKTIPTGDKVLEIVEKIPSIEHALIVPYLGEPGTILKRSSKAQSWDEALGAFEAKPVEFTRLPFSHPVFILYSSGTTGTPKCIVHSAGGVLIQLMKEHQLHCDLREGERLFYFTTLGWMMWNWLVAGLASGATLALYDGSPFHPNGNVLFDYADEAQIDVFGTSAKWIDSVKKAGLRPRDTHKLSTVRMITSTGSPLAPESFDFVYEAIKPDVHLASIAGGTDLCSCFVLGNPLSPVYRGEIQGPASAWPSMCSTMRAGPCHPARASWSAPSRSPRCRLGSGTIPAGRNITAPISSVFRAFGTTAISPNGRSMAVSSCKAGRTRRSIRAACGSGRRRFTGRWSSLRRSGKPSLSARIGTTMCALCFSLC